MVEGLGVSQVFAFLAPYLREMGVAGGRPAAVRRAVLGPDLRRRHAVRAAVGRLGRQVQPQGGHRPELPRRGGRVRLRRPVARAVAARAEPAPDRLPARQHRGDARRRSATSSRGTGSGRSIALFGASGPIGFAVGPCLGGFLVDGLGLDPAGMFWVSAGLSVATGALVWFGSREVRPEVIPDGRVLRLAFGALRGVLADRPSAGSSRSTASRSSPTR